MLDENANPPLCWGAGKGRDESSNKTWLRFILHASIEWVITFEQRNAFVRISVASSALAFYV